VALHEEVVLFDERVVVVAIHAAAFEEVGQGH